MKTKPMIAATLAALSLNAHAFQVDDECFLAMLQGQAQRGTRCGDQFLAEHARMSNNAKYKETANRVWEIYELKKQDQIEEYNKEVRRKNLERLRSQGKYISPNSEGK